MEIKELNKPENIEQDKRLLDKYSDFEKLLSELRKKEIPSEIANLINQDVDEFNSFSGSNKELLKYIKKSKFNILKLVEKELKLVPKNLYRSRWLAIGMSAFGVPFGVVFGISLGNMAFLGIGIPIGMVMGMGIGARMDKKAFEEGRQLNLEFKN